MKLFARIQSLDALTLQVKYMRNAAALGLKAGVEEAALVLEEGARSRVPVLTGNLRDHIHTETVLDEDLRQERKVTAVIPAGNKEGFDPAYARRIEYGFVGADSLGRVYNQPAQPYMRPTADADGPEAKQRIRDSVYEELAAASSKVAARRLRR